MLGVAGCSPFGNKTETNQAVDGTPATVVNFALDTAGGGALQFRMAKAKGIFSKYGIEPVFHNFPYGIDTLNAMLIGRSETGTAADYALLNSLAKGDMTVVSTLGRSRKDSGFSSVLLAKGDVQSATQLRGKRLGVAKGTVYEYIWAKYLEQQGIPEQDIVYVPFQSPDEAIVAMEKGQMDAVWAGGILIEKFKKLDGVHVLATSKDANIKIVTYFVMQQAFVKQHEKAVGHILQALNESIAYVPKHPEETADVAFKELKLPKDGVLKDIDQVNYVIGFSQEDFDHLQAMKTWLEKRGLLKVKYNLKDKINVDPLKRVLPHSVTYSP
ncbi:ABC transporter substrate-binding protein [Paenibacillus sp. 481]|nr:ABC transporter substrate-binding protein [Paenibacillus sp. 481]